MTVKRDDAYRNTMADYFATVFEGATLTIYDAAPPTDPDTAYSGNVLAQLTLPLGSFSVTGPTASRSGTWSVVATGTGTAAGFRLEATTGEHFDGAISADMTLSDTSIVTGGTFTVTTFDLTWPE